jgi:hypothetical protein
VLATPNARAVATRTPARARRTGLEIIRRG